VLYICVYKSCRVFQFLTTLNSIFGGRERLIIGISTMNGECSCLLISFFSLPFVYLSIFYVNINKIAAHFTCIYILYFLYSIECTHIHYRLYKKALLYGTFKELSRVILTIHNFGFTYCLRM
jgi:hypothetical protein